MNHSRSFNLVIGLILCVLGAVLVLLPENIYDLILDLALFVCFFNTLYQLWQYISKRISPICSSDFSPCLSW